MINGPGLQMLKYNDELGVHLSPETHSVGCLFFGLNSERRGDLELRYRSILKISNR